MDPLSLSSAAGGTTLSCGRISCSLINYADDVKNIDVAVASFRTEVNSLEDLLITIDTSHKAYPVTAEDTNAPLWSSIKTSLDDCDSTLQRLDSELDKIKQKNSTSQSTRKKSFYRTLEYERRHYQDPQKPDSHSCWSSTDVIELY